MIDSSSSSCEGKAFNKQLEFCKTVLKEAYIDAGYIRVGLLTYNDRSKIEFHLNKHSTKSDLFAAMDQLNCTSGLTNMADALSAIRTAMFIPENGDRPDASNIAVLITDGLSNVKDGRTILEADLTRKENIQIYTIGIGVPFLKEMRNIASKPLWRFLYDVSNVEELIQLGAHIYETICKR
ncbi:hypothetical protein FSP39_012585 [Pinctada imbricata]|uniref:VWFA domain-containing protein n=1 Tax=Pinctada imbricata TaxID=66713 RepID=A0AA88XI21_PINIB|nr:hypothetical protein FSP39_012585 [Pinctada imbricata]